MERAIEIFAAIQLLIIGLSHLLQPRAWEFQVPGALFVVLAGLMAFVVLRA